MSKSILALRRFNTKEDVINALEAKWGKESFDFSQVEPVRTSDKVHVTCKRCGNQMYVVLNNLLRGTDCKKCAAKKLSSLRNRRKKEKKERTVYGVGVNDYTGNVRTSDGDKIASYKAWINMLHRCYVDDGENLTYKTCKVCNEWLRFSVFKEWFDENYVEGYALDKDILMRNNQMYSPEVCCFVPQEINNLFTKRQNHRGTFLVGVCLTPNKKRYTAQISVRGRRIKIWVFDTEKEAFDAYKARKEALIKEIATEYYNNGK